MSAGVAEIVVFTLPVCPRCEVVKEWLENEDVEFVEMSMESAEGITELRVNGCFAMEAPVVKYGDKFLEESELFDADGEMIPLWE